MARLKVGDRVKYVGKDRDYSKMFGGKIGTVVGIESDGFFVVVKFHNWKKGWTLDSDIRKGLLTSNCWGFSDRINELALLPLIKFDRKNMRGK